MTENNANLVVGSGFAGVAAAIGLLSKGETVLMLDAGVDLEPEKCQLVDNMSAESPEQWTTAQLHSIKSSVKANADGIPKKLIYGSDFPYRRLDHLSPFDPQGIEFFHSFGKGGLSNVWGGAILPYRQSDIQDWPITAETLGPHYRSVLQHMRLAAGRDDLEALFPLYTDAVETLHLPTQSRVLLARLERSKGALARDGITYGRARLAFQQRSHEPHNCVYCGLCMYGCPYGLIYSTRTTVNSLSSNPRFSYSAGWCVNSFQETTDGIALNATYIKTGEERTFAGSRAFVGGGLYSTARIVLNSLQRYDEDVPVKHSDYFLLPLLSYSRTRGASQEKLNTLSQIFIELNDERIGPYPVHLQVYSYNDLYYSALKQLLGRAFLLFKPFALLLLERLLLVQGYIHSAQSSGMMIRLSPGPRGAMHIRPLNISTYSHISRSVAQKLTSLRSHLGAYPLAWMLRRGQPGAGCHSGGTFPMKLRPSGLETDILGRPVGYRRLHLVDSSTFPSIPSTTISLTVMANAHRIATESVLLSPGN